MAAVKDMLKEKDGVVYSVPVTASIREALQLMAKWKIGALPVMDGEKIVGIFSERDFARNAADRQNLSLNDPVSSLMSHPVLYVMPEQTIEECMAVMTAKHLRHLPVLENEKLIGMISIGDVVKFMLAEKQSTINSLEYFKGLHTI
ncbi:MAG: CBS domain-containing protein [Anaerolineaceae bacterium]|nr:CBS domain-containing protein [Anaerolineaceae bacterium]